MANVVPNLVSQGSSQSFMSPQKGMFPTQTPTQPSGGNSLWDTNIFSKIGNAAGNLGGNAISGAVNFIAGQPVVGAPQAQTPSQPPIRQQSVAQPQQTQSAQSTAPQNIPAQNSANTVGNQPANPYAGMTPIYGPNGATSYLAPGGTMAPGWSTVQNPTDAPAIPGIFPRSVQALSSTQPAPVVNQANQALIGQATGANPAAGTIGALGGILANGSPAVQQATQNVRGLQQAQSEIANNPNLASEVASGRGQALTGQIQAGETALQNALAQQSQQITAGNVAGGQALTGQAEQIAAANEAAGTANTAQGNQITAQTNAAAAAQPQPYGITQTPYNPTAGTFGTMAGTNAVNGVNGATAAGIISGQENAGQTFAQNNAILGKVQAQIPGLMQAMQSDNFNPSDVNQVNQISQWAQGSLSNSSIPKIQGSLNDIVGGLSQVLGVPSSGGSDFRLQFAGSIVNALQKGSSIADAVNFATQQAIAGNQGYLQGAQGNTQNQPQGQGNTQTFSGVNYSLVNGKWVAQ